MKQEEALDNEDVIDENGDIDTATASLKEKKKQVKFDAGDDDSDDDMSDAEGGLFLNPLLIGKKSQSNGKS